MDNDPCAAEGMPDQHERRVDLQDFKRFFEIGLAGRHIVAAGGFVREAMPAQIERDDAVRQREFLKLVYPLSGVSAKTMDEHQRPLRTIGRDVDCRESYQRICGNTHFVPVKIQVNIHKRSLNELTLLVNFELRY